MSNIIEHFEEPLEILGVWKPQKNTKLKHLDADFEAIEEFVEFVEVAEENSYFKMTADGVDEVFRWDFVTYIAIKKEFLSNPNADNKICLDCEDLPSYANMPNLTDKTQDLILTFYRENR